MADFRAVLREEEPVVVQQAVRPQGILADRVGKVVCDALNGVAWYDDTQITDGEVHKFWAAEQPRIEVKIWEAEA